MTRGAGRPFAKGQSGNPGGRPRIPEELKSRAQAYSVEALDTLHALMRDPEQSGSVRVSAAVAIMDRGYGKSTVTVDMQPKRTIADYTTDELRALAAHYMERLGDVAEGGEVPSLVN